MVHAKIASRTASDNGMEFEPFPGRSEIQVSEVLTTPKGDKIRAIVTTGGSIVLTGVGRPSSDTVILTGDVFGSGPEGTVMAKGFWDAVIGIAADIVKGLVKDGGSGGCTTTTTIEADAKSGKTTVTLTTSCG